MSDLDCGAKCLKGTLIAFNILFWLCGGALLGIGIWMAVDDEAFDTLSITNPDGLDDPFWAGIVYTTIAVGALVFLVGFLGWVGACCENGCMLVTYCCITGICLAGELVIGILAIVYRDSIDDAAVQSMYEDVIKSYTRPSEQNVTVTVNWDKQMQKLECCGAYNHTDWWKNDNFDSSQGDSVPYTCCKMNDDTEYPWARTDVRDVNKCMAEGRSPNFDNKEELFDQGCGEATSEWVEDQSAIIIGVSFGFMAVQILGIIFAACLKCELDKS